MAKSSKKSKEAAAPLSAPAEPIPTPQNGDGAAKPAAKSTRPKASSTKSPKSKSVPKPRGSTPRKASAPRKTRAIAPREAAAAIEISDAEIRIRAYFISQERMREGRPGTSSDDWLEARRQLEEQASRRG